MEPLAKAAIACGADGLMIEVHNDPAHALSDGPQSLNFEQFDSVMNNIKPYIELSGEDTVMSFEKVGFIGLGLIGGSIAKTIKKKYPDTTLIATARHADTIQEAHDFGTIENDTLLPLSDFADCDYIFLCTPVQQNLIYLKKLKSVIKPSCIITDVGSVKSDIHKAVTALGMEANFIGGHPMCGSEKTGFLMLRNIFWKMPTISSPPTAKTTPAQLEEFHALVKSLGSVPMILDYEKHDFATAAISHLPHIIASSLVNLVSV